MQKDVHPFQQGFTAFKPEVKLSMLTLADICPYLIGSESCIQWISGYYTAWSGLDYSTDEEQS